MTQEGIPGALSFGERFAVERIANGGVIVNLADGSYFQLNETAAMACMILSEIADESKAEVGLADRMGIAPGDARSIIDGVLRDLGEAAPREDPVGPFRYRRADRGYALCDGEEVILEIDAGLRTVVLRAPSRRFSVLDCIRAVTPKLLYLSGVTVMHASACAINERVIGFSGSSGSGKTTTVRAFVAAGATPISEDLVVLVGGNSSPSFFCQGESNVHAWTDEVARRLSLDPTSSISYADLVDAASGPTRRIDEVCFVDPNRRVGTIFHRRRLSAIEGTLSLLRNTFLGAASHEAWRMHLHTSHELAEQISLFEAVCPNGLEALVRAAREGYTTNSAS